MSSDTLRGIGQEGDDEGGEVAATQAVDPNVQATEGEPTGEQLKLSEALDDCFRSLDSMLPGTVSLDSKVPDPVPSPEAKVPNFAATLLGVPAPVVSRDRGTVQGRDVHLPAESQRLAGLRPVEKEPERDLAAPRTVDHSEPTQADPIVGAAVARASMGDQATADPGGDTPWYDRIPPADEATDDPRPNMLARVAIGAALAAILSIFIFGFVRLRATSSTVEETPANQGVPERNTAESQTRTETPTPTVAIPPPLPSENSAPAVAPTSDRTMADTPPSQRAVFPPSPSMRTVDSVSVPSLPRPRAPATRISTGTGQPHGIGTQGVGESDSAGGTPTNAPSATAAESIRNRSLSKAPGTETTAAMAARPRGSDTPAAAPATSSPSPSEKQKSKPAYDPDSTLPLNLE